MRIEKLHLQVLGKYDEVLKLIKTGPKNAM